MDARNRQHAHVRAANGEYGRLAVRQIAPLARQIRQSRIDGAEYRQGASMPVLKRMTPVAVSLAIIFAVTVVLFYLKDAFQGVQHLIFFYLVPTAFVAMIYGSVLAMFCAIVATSVAAFFLYAPIYSLYVSDPREVGELILFAVIGLIGAKCVAELRRPPSESFHRGSPLVE